MKLRIRQIIEPNGETKYRIERKYFRLFWANISANHTTQIDKLLKSTDTKNHMNEHFIAIRYHSIESAEHDLEAITKAVLKQRAIKKQKRKAVVIKTIDLNNKEDIFVESV